MARSRLFASFKAPFKARPAAEQIRSRIQDAEAAAAEAERAYRIAALAAEAGGDPAHEVSAERGLNAARQDVARLEAILLEVEAQDAEEARQAQRATDDAQDAELADAFDQVAARGKALAPILASYVAHYRKLVQAAEHAQSLATLNPRVRGDLNANHLGGLVALELTRAADGKMLPPGADAWAGVARDRRELTSLTDALADLAAGVRASLVR